MTFPKLIVMFKSQVFYSQTFSHWFAGLESLVMCSPCFRARCCLSINTRSIFLTRKNMVNDYVKSPQRYVTVSRAQQLHVRSTMTRSKSCAQIRSKRKQRFVRRNVHSSYSPLAYLSHVLYTFSPLYKTTTCCTYSARLENVR